jgi:hypothetical protein
MKPITLKGLFGRLLVAIAMMLLWATPVFGATTADVTLTYTVVTLDITDNATSVAFGSLNAGSSAYTNTSYIGITNNSNVQIDATIGVTGSTWTGGSAHTHSDTATAGADTVGLLANRGGTWESGDIIVKYASPNYIYENCAAGVDWDYGLKLLVPTSSTDGVEKTNTVRITIGAG